MFLLGGKKSTCDLTMKILEGSHDSIVSLFFCSCRLKTQILPKCHMLHQRLPPPMCPSLRNVLSEPVCLPHAAPLRARWGGEGPVGHLCLLPCCSADSSNQFRLETVSYTLFPVLFISYGALRFSLFPVLFGSFRLLCLSNPP